MIKKAGLIGLAIPTYNRPEMLKQLLSTVPGVHEIYVSDNGGFVDSDIYGANKNIKIDKTTTILPAFVNWNRAVSGTVSDYVVIPSDDDLYLDNAFTIIENEINNNSDVDIFIFGHNNIDENNKIISSWMPDKYQKFEPPFGFEICKFGVEARMPSIIFKRSLFDRIGCFDENFLVTAGDSDLIQRSLIFGKSLFVPKIISCYRIWSKGSTSQTITSDDWLKEIEVWTNKIASIAGTELQKANAEFSKKQFLDEIYARNLLSGVANKLKAEGGGSARRYLFRHRYPRRATAVTQLNLVKMIIKSFLGR